MIGCCDCLELPLADLSVDLVFTSPPYEDARTYDIGFSEVGDAWVEWAVPRFMECLRVCRGMVCWVLQGRTKQFRWSAVPALLMADLHRQGVHLRRPHIYHRVGIPGSGGPDDWRNDYEFVIRATHGGKLPWSDNTATGHEAKWPVGGKMSNRTQDGRRINAQLRPISRITKPRGRDGKLLSQGYVPPKICNPGDIVKCNAGGGVMGSRLCHETEAPFPESLVEPYIKSFCPPEGIVLDPMCGSGTTLAVALKHGREAIGFDIRESQCELTRRRVDVSETLFTKTSGKTTKGEKHG